MAIINPQTQTASSRRAVSPVLYFSHSGQTTNDLLHFQMVDADVYRLQVLHTPPQGNGEFHLFYSHLQRIGAFSNDHAAGPANRTPTETRGTT